MRRISSDILRSDKGSVAPTVGLSLFALIAAGGIAFDYGRLASMDTELQNAADQAALAAASQLDGTSTSMARAEAAARTFLTNTTYSSNDSGGMNVTISAVDVPSQCGTGTVPPVEFFAIKADAESGCNGFVDPARFDEAKFVRVGVTARQAVYALTPIVGAFRSGSINADATAGLGSSICKVPPLMICNPSPGTAFPVTAGKGVLVVAHQNGQSWSSGNFGFLNAGQSNNGAPDLLAAMAYQDAALTCQDTDTGDVDTGATVPAIDAANTRFDIYNFASGGGSTLGACYNGSCPAALNVTKDVIHSSGFNGNNACKMDNGNGGGTPTGWKLAANRYWPLPGPGPTWHDTSKPLDAMGLPRDNCHYTSYDSTLCSGSRIGDGVWGRADYWAKNHTGAPPTGYSSWTRYQTYIWEIQNNAIPNGLPAGSNVFQYGRPQCSTGTPDPLRDRRLLTVAIADNCANLSGTSVPVQISRWVDMFFVEPGINGRGNGSTNDEIYLEVVRETQTAGNGSNAQVIRRDVPYLVK